MIRSIVAVVTGLIVASIVIATGELLRNRLYPPPTEMEIERARLRLAVNSSLRAEGRYQDAYFQAEDIARDLPIPQLVAVLLSCAIGTVPGAWLAASLARRAPKLHGLVVGALLLAASLILMFMVPYLWWYWAPGGAILLPAAYAGGWLGARSQRFTSRKSPMNATNDAAKDHRGHGGYRPGR